MYCSSCGNELKKGLNYCNSCGARVVDIEKEKSGSRFEHISTAIGFIGVAGIAGFVFLVRMLLRNDVDEPVIVLLSFALLATTLGIIFMLIKLLWASSEKESQDVEFRNEAPIAIKSVDTNQLEEPRETPASVVENTTRTLDKVPIERK